MSSCATPTLDKCGLVPDISQDTEANGIDNADPRYKLSTCVRETFSDKMLLTSLGPVETKLTDEMYFSFFEEVLQKGVAEMGCPPCAVKEGVQVT